MHAVTVQASACGVLVSEVYPAPSSAETEWVEIVNTCAEPIAIVGFSLYDELTTPSLLYTFPSSEPPIAGFSFRVVSFSGSKLNNSGDGVYLYEAGGQLLNYLNYSSSQIGKSQTRMAGAGSATSAATASPGSDDPSFPLLSLMTASPSPSATPTATPASSPASPPSPAPTLHPSPTATLITPGEAAEELNQINQLSLSEVLACPSVGASEWLEMYNAGPTAVDLDEWKITDESGNYRYLSGSIASGAFAVLSWSGSLLNNNGDSFQLTTSNGTTIGEPIRLPACSSGQSYVWTPAGAWQLALMSPGNKNPLIQREEATSTASASLSMLTTDNEPHVALANSHQSTDKTAADTATRSVVALAFKLPQLVPSASQSAAASSSGVLGLITESPQPTEQYPTAPLQPWSLYFVIMAGLLWTIAGVVPRYDRFQKVHHSLATPLATTTSLGWDDLSVQLAVKPTQS